MTGSAKQSMELSSSVLTGGSSTPRPFELFLVSLEYWIARSSRATTSRDINFKQRYSVPRHDAPEFFLNIPPSQDRGRRECRAPMRPHPRVLCSKHAR